MGPTNPDEASLTLADASDPIRAQCEGELLAGNTLVHLSTQRAVKAYTCVDAPGSLRGIYVDAKTLQPVDLQQLRADDVNNFKFVDLAIDRPLRARLDAAPENDLVDVSVWFKLDESDLPLKEDLVGDPKLAAKTEQILEQRITHGAQELVTNIRALMASDPSFATASFKSVVTAGTRFGAPVVQVHGTRKLVEQIGQLDEVGLITLAPTVRQSTGSAYFTETTDNVLDDVYGADGTNQTVANLESGRPDSYTNLPNAVAGSCSAGGVSKLCHCPAGPTDSHSRMVAGVVATNTTSFGSDHLGGMADQAKTIFANAGNAEGTCRASGFSDDWTDAFEWALINGAHVVNMSTGDGPVGAPQASDDRYFDYKATHSPFPLVVAAAGNNNGIPGTSQIPAHELYDGLVVGASNHSGSRTTEQMANFSQWVNWFPGSSDAPHGFELPHIVAPGISIDTAGATGASSPGGTSFAAPQIAAIAANVTELFPGLQAFPELLMAGFMAGANANADGGSGGTWPLDTGDGIDDRDGAGLVNAWGTGLVLDSARKVDGGNAAAGLGNDHNTLSPTTFPKGQFYSEVYNASVANGDTLRVASVMTSQVSCSPSPSIPNCTSAATFPRFELLIYDGASLVGLSTNVNQNYQLAFKKNTSGATKTYQIKMWMVDWSGSTQTFQALAWVSGGQG